MARYVYRVLVNNSDQYVPYDFDSQAAATRKAKSTAALYKGRAVCIERARLLPRGRRMEFSRVRCIRAR